MGFRTGEGNIKKPPQFFTVFFLFIREEAVQQLFIIFSFYIRKKHADGIMKTIGGLFLFLPVMRIASGNKQPFKFQTFGTMCSEQVYGIRTAIHFDQGKAISSLSISSRWVTSPFRSMEGFLPRFFFNKVEKGGKHLQQFRFFGLFMISFSMTRFAENAFKQRLNGGIGNRADQGFQDAPG